jgi:hypothetical protein
MKISVLFCVAIQIDVVVLVEVAVGVDNEVSVVSVREVVEMDESGVVKDVLVKLVVGQGHSYKILQSCNSGSK